MKEDQRRTVQNERFDFRGPHIACYLEKLKIGWDGLRWYEGDL